MHSSLNYICHSRDMGALNIGLWLVYHGLAPRPFGLGDRAFIGWHYNFILFPHTFRMATQKRWEAEITMNDALPIISILTLIFSLVLISEIFKIKKVQRKLENKMKYFQKDFDEVISKKKDSWFYWLFFRNIVRFCRYNKLWNKIIFQKQNRNKKTVEYMFYSTHFS